MNKWSYFAKPYSFCYSLIHNLIPMKKFILLPLLIITLKFPVSAQSYSVSPNDSIVTDVPFDEQTILDILQNNLLSDTLWLSWQKINAVVPSGWQALICDNNTCYGDLKDNGNM